MALDYAGSAALMNDLDFRGRVKVACLKYAGFISLEAADVPAHSTRLKWANNTMLMPDGAAGTVTPTVVMDPAVQEAGATITDGALQSATEGAINRMM
jgi:hypothetical protein